MKLTVAIRIFGGFAFITILLLVISISSLFTLNNINDATYKVNELAIPSVSGSNQLKVQLTQMGNLSLKAYYQTELSPLAANKAEFEEASKLFNKQLKNLIAVVQQHNEPAGNLREIESKFVTFSSDIEELFNARKSSIDIKANLVDTVDTLEEKADDAATLLLDLADRDDADTRLKSVLAIGSKIEGYLNAVVSLSFEYRDNIKPDTESIIAKEISNAMESLTSEYQAINNELQAKGLSDLAEELTDSFGGVNRLLSSNGEVFTLKNAQLSALKKATDTLASSQEAINEEYAVIDKELAAVNAITKEVKQLVEDKVSSGNTQTIIIMIASIIASIVIARITLLSITRPLDRVNEMLNVVASGDLTRKLDDKGTDEFAELSKNCNKLIDSLRELIQSIISRSTQLAAAAEQTSAVTAQSTSAIEEQRNQVEQAASATTEMSSTSRSVLDSANDALTEIKHADDEAERVKKISSENKHTIEALASEVESASQVINKLQQDSSSIGGILDVIRGIAEQTNLLALNAAIEAARAGEQGRGFAVVADEVRTLASRTQESTQEIQNMIEVLQTGAEKAVTVMNVGKSQASTCVEQSEVAANALETITHAVHEAYDRSEQIASAAQEQSVVAHEISENLESIVAIAEQTTAGSKQTATSSSEVARLAEELQESVQEFKV